MEINEEMYFSNRTLPNIFNRDIVLKILELEIILY